MNVQSPDKIGLIVAYLFRIKTRKVGVLETSIELVWGVGEGVLLLTFRSLSDTIIGIAIRSELLSFRVALPVHMAIRP